MPAFLADLPALLSGWRVPACGWRLPVCNRRNLTSRRREQVSRQGLSFYKRRLPARGRGFQPGQKAALDKAGQDKYSRRMKQGLLHCLAFSVMAAIVFRSEEHTSELQSLRHVVCRLLL